MLRDTVPESRSSAGGDVNINDLIRDTNTVLAKLQRIGMIICVYMTDRLRLRN